MSVVGQAADNTGTTRVSPVPPAGSRERLGAPGAYPKRVNAAGMVFAEFDRAVFGARQAKYAAPSAHPEWARGDGRWRGMRHSDWW